MIIANLTACNSLLKKLSTKSIFSLSLTKLFQQFFVSLPLSNSYFLCFLACNQWQKHYLTYCRSIDFLIESKCFSCSLFLIVMQGSIRDWHNLCPLLRSHWRWSPHRRHWDTNNTRRIRKNPYDTLTNEKLITKL